MVKISIINLIIIETTNSRERECNVFGRRCKLRVRVQKDLNNKQGDSVDMLQGLTHTNNEVECASCNSSTFMTQSKLVM